MVCIRLRAVNDCNGNPRRVYVVFNRDGSIKCAVDEGYAGRGALAGFGDKIDRANIVDFDTTPGEYRRLLREFGPQRAAGRAAR
jgi:hypothetical protein